VLASDWGTAGMNKPIPANVEYLPAGDVCAAFSGMSPVRQTQLVRYANALAGRIGFSDGSELISEAYVRIANGDRQCPRDTDPVTFIFSVVRSLNSDVMFVTETRRLKRLDPGASFSPVELIEAAEPDEHGAQHAERLDRFFSALEAKVNSDDEMGLLVLGVAEGLRGKALLSFVGCDAQRLATLRTRLLRYEKEIRDAELKRSG
jgi:hypothetical protein